MNIVLDTNVFISGIFWSGPPFEILKAWRQNKITLVISQAILDEYDRVSKELSKQFQGIDLSAIMELLTINSKICFPIKLKEPVSRDSDDDKFIACALTANVKYIVSGDKDLLDVSGYKGLEIIKPGLFVKKILFYLNLCHSDSHALVKLVETAS